MKKYFIIILLFAAFLTSCIKNDTKPVQPLPEVSPNGLFILNQGNFMYENASLSFYNKENKSLLNEIFYKANGFAPGDVMQSMAVADTLGFLVMNNSGKIHIINLNSFKAVGKISGFTSPRYIHFLDQNKAYVSDLYARGIWIVKPKTLEITGFVDLNEKAASANVPSSDMMVQYQNFVFTNSWNYDNRILVIDTQTDQLVDSISVIFQPTAIVLDKNEKLWVLSDGGFQGNPFGYERPGLTRIDAETHEIETIFHLEVDDYPQTMAINRSRDTLYFINRHIYRHAVGEASAPELFIESPYALNLAGFYGLAVDPSTSEIFVADAIDFVQPGLVYRYSPGGIALDTLRVGIIPSEFCFRPQ
jgi:DNA-binding beta-propeller fold protein YncE